MIDATRSPSWHVCCVSTYHGGVRLLKYILYLIIIPVLSLCSGLPAYGGGAGDIVSTRAGVHSDFHRLVIELRDEAVYSTKKSGKTLEVLVSGIDSSGFSGGYAGTDFFRLIKVETRIKDKVRVTSFFLNLKKEPARVRFWTMEKPYRILVDMYPDKAHPSAGSVKHSKAHGRSLAAAKPSHEKKHSVAHTTKKPQSTKLGRRAGGRAAGRSLAFNKGWRWRYRVETVRRLKDYYYVNIPDPALDELREYLPLTQVAHWEESMDAPFYLRTLTEKGEISSARTLQDIIVLTERDLTNTEVEQDLLRISNNYFTPMAHFLLASSYEREGLYPESLAYYAMAYDAGSVKKLKAIAALGRGRVLFFSGHVGEAGKWFRKAEREGSEEAAAWLANSLVLKGELKAAWSRYSKLENLRDPLSLMGLADLKMLRGDYKGAARDFKSLKSRFRGKSFIESFFALREADTALARGEVDEAVAGYTAIQKSGDSEGSSMAVLALADYYAYEGNILIKARDLYKEVAGARSIGSPEALLSLSEVYEDLGEHSEAMKALDDFFIRYPFATGADMVGLLRSKISYNWVVDLYREKKWLHLATVNYRYGHWISFGKRAENFLRVGEALMRIGLTPDAVLALGKAEKIGRLNVRVKAGLLLTRIYLDQRDFEAAEKLLKDTKPDLRGRENSALWADYYLETQYLKGNYREVISLGRGRTEGPILLMRARAYNELAEWDKAMSLYSEAIAEFKHSGDKTGLMRAETGYGDTLFLSGGYASAIDAYSKAAEMADKVSAVTERWARYRLSLSYAGAGMGEEALRSVKELKKKDNSYGDWAEALTIAQNKGL